VPAPIKETHQPAPKPEPQPEPEPVLQPEPVVENELPEPPEPVAAVPIVPVPVVEKIEISPPQPVPAPTARDIAEQEIVDLILRAQRVSKSTGAPLEVCLEQLRKHLQPVVVEAAPKPGKVRRFEFQSSPDGLLTGAKMIEE
jgi:hypothetical protein